MKEEKKERNLNPYEDYVHWFSGLSHQVEDGASTEKEQMSRSRFGSDGSKSQTLLSSLSLDIPIRHPTRAGSRPVADTQGRSSMVEMSICT